MFTSQHMLFLYESVFIHRKIKNSLLIGDLKLEYKPFSNAFQVYKQKFIILILMTT